MRDPIQRGRASACAIMRICASCLVSVSSQVIAARDKRAPCGPSPAQSNALPTGRGADNAPLAFIDTLAASWGSARQTVPAALLAFALALFFLGQGISAPFVKDAEPESAEWIQSVASGQHRLIPRSFYGTIQRKPPLFYWLAGGLSAVIGNGRVDEARARAVSWLAAAAIAVVVFLWSTAAMGPGTGWLAFFFLLGSYAFASRATLALTDMLLCLLVFGAWCLLYGALEDEPSWGRTIAIGVIVGLGILTKGPIALVLPALAGLIYLLVVAPRLIRDVIRRPWPWTVLAVAILVAAPWYAAAFHFGGDEFARIFLQENFGHFFPATLGGTGEAARPVYYIAVKTLAGAMPLALLLPALAVALWPGALTPRVRKALLFQLSFVFAVQFFFGAASAKRDDYVLPAMPGLAIAFAALFTVLDPGLTESARWAAKLRDALSALAAAGTLIGLITALVWIYTGANLRALSFLAASPDRMTARLFLGYAHRFTLPFAAILGAAAVASGAIMVGVLRRRTGLSGAGLGLLSLAGVLFVTAVIRPELARERTLKYVAGKIQHLTDGAGLYVVHAPSHELSFYCERGLPGILTRAKVLPVVKQPAYLFAYDSELRDLGGEFQKRLRRVARWPVPGTMGPPALYAIEPDAKDLQLPSPDVK